MKFGKAMITSIKNFTRNSRAPQDGSISFPAANKIPISIIT